MPDEITRESIKREAKEMASQLAEDVAAGVGDALTGALGVRALESSFAELGKKLGETLTKSLAEEARKSPISREIPGVVSPTGLGTELEHFREQLERLVVQLRSTIDLLSKSGTTLVGEREMGQIRQVAEAILERQGITPETARSFVDTVKQVQDTLGQMGEEQKQFQVSIKDIFDVYHKILEDHRISLDVQRDLIEDVQRYMSGEETPLAREIRAFDVSQLDKEKVKEFLALIDRAREEESGELKGTLEELNQTFQEAFLTPGETRATWFERVRSAGKPFVEAFVEAPGKFTIGKDIRAGLMDMLFGGMGLGPLARELRLPERMESLWGVGVGKIRELAGGMFGRGGLSPSEEIRETREEVKRGSEQILKTIELKEKKRELTDGEHRKNIQAILKRVHARPSEMVPEIEESADIAASPKMIERLGPRFTGWLTKMFPGLSQMLMGGGLAGAALTAAGVAATIGMYVTAAKTGLEAKKTLEDIGKAKEAKAVEYATRDIGGLTAMMESRRDSGAISVDVNRAKSYGTYQMNVKGELPGFVARYGEKFGLTAPLGEKEFDVQWRKAYAERPQEFAASQHMYMVDVPYTRLTKHMRGKGIETAGKSRLASAIFSVSTTHGFEGQKIIVEDAIKFAKEQGLNFSDLPEDRQIDILYSARSAYVSRARGIPEKAKPELLDRFKREKRILKGEEMAPVKAPVPSTVAPTPSVGAPTPSAVAPGGEYILPIPAGEELRPTALSPTRKPATTITATPTLAREPVETVPALVPPAAPPSEAPAPPPVTMPSIVHITERRKSIDDYGIAIANLGMCS